MKSSKRPWSSCGLARIDEDEPSRGQYLAAMGDELEKDGIASWNIEYRFIGQPGGG